MTKESPGLADESTAGTSRSAGVTTESPGLADGSTEVTAKSTGVT